MIKYTDKKENQIFLKYKEIQNGAVVTSYMINGLLIYEEIFVHFLIIGSPYSFMNFLIYEENFIFYQCTLQFHTYCTLSIYPILFDYFIPLHDHDDEIL